MITIRRHILFDAAGDDLLERSVQYFEQSGFKVVDRQEQGLTIKRGSAALNMCTFNPLKVKSAIRVTIKEGMVTATFEVDTVYQLMSVEDEKLWDLFVDNFKLYLTSDIDFVSVNERALRATKKGNLKYLGWALLGAVVVGVPAGVIAYLTDIDSIASTGVALGAFGLVMKKMNDERKRNANSDERGSSTIRRSL
ncbi:hypothetical protein [Paraflavitalea pollutisoli]|uniref:hypothetical protein n=1 Tax=Paraflavitalea pollutisoli TaxID=3034143 RepID=UPI0023EB80C7|nr:hypothetical protein [Paraflavitalea sp. H1-2-19X]